MKQNMEKKHPLHSDDERIEKLTEQADELLAAQKYTEASDLYKSILLLEPENLHCQLNKATSDALHPDSEYDVAAFGKWAEAVEAARIALYEYYGECQDFVDVFGKEIELLEHIAISRATKALVARKALAEKLDEDTEELRSLYTLQTINDPQAKAKIDGAMRDLFTEGRQAQGAMVAYIAALLVSWTTQMRRFLECFHTPELFDVHYFESLRSRVAAQQRKWHFELASCFHCSLREQLIELMKAENKASKESGEVIDQELKKILAILDGYIKRCKDAIRAAYWKAHTEERKKLEEERATLVSERENREKEISQAEKKAETDNVAAQNVIAELQQKRRALGIFKFKEKKEARAAIEAAEQEAVRIRNMGRDAVDKIVQKRDRLTERIAAIDLEFTKDR